MNVVTSYLAVMEDVHIRKRKPYKILNPCCLTSNVKGSASEVPTQEKIIEENDRIKNVIAAAAPTQEKFIVENVHIEVQKKKYISAVPTDSSSFQQALMDSWSRTPGSRTPGHERLSTSRREKNKKTDV
ncbi:hypothetical protein TNCV_333571 [Trichonephila clavipes]|nr:hypothetical protein TNCV_333571 [Trichonephila clavipes]